MKLYGIIAAALMALTASKPTQADPVAMPASLSSGQKFVQGFYDWYVSKALSNEGDSPGWAIALKDRAQDFDPKLAGALKDDLAAQAKSPDDIVGLDFDPFLNTQDPAARYISGGARWKDKILLVDVYGVVSGKRASKPDVVDELAFDHGHWLFVNFDFSGGGDLVSTLATLKSERERHQ